MLYFAYDGTINGDWVSHYAIRLALHRPGAALTVVHIDDGSLPREELEERLHLLAARCALVSVEFKAEVHPRRRGAKDDLEALVPPGPETYLVCGTRVKEGGRGYLTGTIAERLLQAGRHQVLAVRVVNPGLLGHPHRVLVPMAEIPEALPTRLPYLSLFLPDLEEVHLLLVEEVGRLRYRNLSPVKGQRLLRHGRAEAAGMEARLRDLLGWGETRLDSRVVISDDVPKEIVIAANQVKADLIYMGASKRNLTSRFFYGNPIEQVLRNTSCDVAIYNGPA